MRIEMRFRFSDSILDRAEQGTEREEETEGSDPGVETSMRAT
jgi:hypothetical protein